MSNYIKTQSIILKAIFFVAIFVIAFLFFTKDSKANVIEGWQFYPASTTIEGINNKDFSNVSNYNSGGFYTDNPYDISGYGSMKGRYNYNSDWQATNLGYEIENEFSFLIWQKKDTYDRTFLYIDKEVGSNIARLGVNGNLCVHWSSPSEFLFTAGSSHDFGTITQTESVCDGTTTKYVSSGYWNLWAYTFGSNYLKIYFCGYSELTNDECILVYNYSFSNTATTYDIEQLYLRFDNGFGYLSEIALLDNVVSLTDIENYYEDKQILSEIVGNKDEIIPITEYPLEMNPLSLISQQISYNICKYHNERYESNIINNNRYYLAHENLTDDHIISTTNLNGFNCDLFSQTPNNYWSFIYSSGITTGQKEFAFWIYDQQEKQIVAYIDDLIIDIVSDEYSSVSPLVPTGNIFNIGDKYLCKLEENCKLEYYYNFNLVPNYTNEISIWEFTMDENLNQNCWIWNEISEMNKCELIATTTIWEMGTFGKDEPIGKSFVTLTATSTPHTQRILMTAETGNIKQSQYVELAWVNDPSYWANRFNDNATSTTNILGLNTRAMACSEEDWTRQDNYLGFSLTRFACSTKKWIIDLSLSPVNWIDGAMNNAKKVLLNIFPFNFVNGIYTAWKDSENINQDNNFLFASLDNNGDIYLEIPDSWQGNGETEILVFGNSIFKYNDKTTAFFSGVRATSTYLLWAMFFLLVYNLMFKIWNIIIGKLEIEKTEEEELRSVGQKAFISQTARNEAKNNPHKYPYSFRKTLK